MPTIDPTTPSGVQPVGFSSGYTIIMSDEFNSTSPDSKWRIIQDFGNSSAPNSYDINHGGNSALRMWWNGNTSTDNCTFVANGGNPFRSRYGYYECRAKVANGRGWFPAFWLYQLNNSNQESPDGQQPELDCTEWVSYENGDNVTGSTFNCMNAHMTILQEGGGGGQSNVRALFYHTQTGHYDTSMSTQYHVYGMKWTLAGGLEWYYDGVRLGAISDPWGSGDNRTFPMILENWWGPNGGCPTPDSSNTPVYNSSNAQDSRCMLFDYVRIWQIGGSGTQITFNAHLNSGPNDGATINGTVHFQIKGDLIANAELLPGDQTLYTPKYGTFSITQQANSHQVCDLDWDTTALANGTYNVRISAFDAPPGQTGNEIVVITRTYIINNVVPTPSSPEPTAQFTTSEIVNPFMRRTRR